MVTFRLLLGELGDEYLFVLTEIGNFAALMN